MHMLIFGDQYEERSEKIDFPPESGLIGRKHKRTEGVCDAQGCRLIVHPDFVSYSIFFPIEGGRKEFLHAMKTVIVQRFTAANILDSSEKIAPIMIDGYDVINPQSIVIDTQEADEIGIPLNPFLSGKWKWEELDHERLTPFLKQQTQHVHQLSDAEFEELETYDELGDETDEQFRVAKIQRSDVIVPQLWRVQSTDVSVSFDEQESPYERFDMEPGQRYLQFHARTNASADIAKIHTLMNALVRGDIEQLLNEKLGEFGMQG